MMSSPMSALQLASVAITNVPSSSSVTSPVASDELEEDREVIVSKGENPAGAATKGVAELAPPSQTTPVIEASETGAAVAVAIPAHVLSTLRMQSEDDDEERGTQITFVLCCTMLRQTLVTLLGFLGYKRTIF